MWAPPGRREPSDSPPRGTGPRRPRWEARGGGRKRGGAGSYGRKPIPAPGILPPPGPQGRGRPESAAATAVTPGGGRRGLRGRGAGRERRGMGGVDAGRVAPPASLVPGARPGAGRGSAAAHGRRGRWGRRAPLRCAAPGTASLRPPPGAGRRAGDNSGRQHACSRPRPPRPAALNPCTAAARRCARRRPGTRSRHRTDERALPRGTQLSTHATHTSCSVAGLRPPSGLCGQSRSGEAGPARGPSLGPWDPHRLHETRCPCSPGRGRVAGGERQDYISQQSPHGAP
ncbi:translation initiation factor IF-2-like [Molothrus ater]|uniref:translation initiation factor IF-2-like n=1 Tax=Molothrus ater TaxID=84834 RepID=UPI00174A3A4B|nr:translation initiation factor IF-2-like [Molothrus ater]